MPAVRYSLADLVPNGIYATQVRRLLTATRELVATMPEQEFRRDALDSSLRDLASQSQSPDSDLFKVLRVALAWPEARPDLFEVILNLGRDGVLNGLDLALTRLTDEAGQ
jgi:hypothetical protein